MIQPSRRRSAARGTGGALSWHLEVARSRGLNRRLMSASVAALLAALLVWLTGLDLVGRTLATVGAGALALLLPTRGSERWALDHIAERRGLAYETALEYGDRVDDFGLAEELRERAGRAVAALDRPTPPRWWLPVLVLAFAALLLPAVGSLLPLRGSGLGSPAGSSASPPGIGAERPEADEPAQARVPDEEEAARIDRSDDAPGAGQETRRLDDAEAGAGGEQGVLDRFLENLRERPPAVEEPGDDAPQGQDPSQSNGRQPGPGERSPGQPQGGGQDQGRAGEDGEEPGQGGGQAPGEQRGEQGDGAGEGEGDAQEQQNPFGETGTTEEQGGEGNEQSEGAGQMPQGEEGVPQPEGQGETAQSLDEGGEGEGEGGQGAGGGATAEQEAGLAGRAQGEELFVEGELRDGPANMAGEVQLPGSDEVEVPGLGDFSTYREQVDRAMTEGRIPLEYQEIIRNYFR